MSEAGTIREFEALYEQIHSCRNCPNTVPSLVRRRVDGIAYRSGLMLMAQAPSEKGVRTSGLHWIGADGRLRPPGGVFLDRFLKQAGYSVDPANKELPRPYTTNVLHCWTGRNGRRDRQPIYAELNDCKPWWYKEIELVRPRAIILLGKPAAESFSAMCGVKRPFSARLAAQGEEVQLGDVSVKTYAVPHPTAPYVGKTEIYNSVFSLVAEALKGC